MRCSPLGRLGLQIAESSKVVGRIGRHRGHDTSSFLGTDSQHWEHVDALVLESERSDQRQADQLVPGHTEQATHLLGHLGVALEREI